jgi:imidazolonepropionase-like amidohydrolase
VNVPRGAEEVRLDGKWIIPGLIDAHTHVEPWMLSRFMAYGVTSIRDAGGEEQTVFGLRDQVNSGTVLGPRMYVSGAAIDAGPGALPHGAVIANGDQARRAVDQLVLAEASQAKISPRIDARLLRPLMDEALTLKIPVAGHLGKVDAVTAAELGVSALEHMTGVVESAVTNPRIFFAAHDDYYRGWNTFERGWAALDSAALERVAGRLVELNVAIVPTLIMHEAYSRLSDPAFVGGLDLTGVPDSIRQRWGDPELIRRARISATDFAAFRRSRPVQDRFVRLYARAGGIVAAGTNTARHWIPPGSSLHTELALLVRAGLEPRRAILAATRDAASLVGADSIGVIRAGALADFIVLYADPLVDITNTRAIEMVVSSGSIYRPDELQRSW